IGPNGHVEPAVARNAAELAVDGRVERRPVDLGGAERRPGDRDEARECDDRPHSGAASPLPRPPFKESSLERSCRDRGRRGILPPSLAIAHTRNEPALEAAPDLQAQLVGRLQRGEPAAVAEAYDVHQAALRAFARKLTGDAGVAEDLVHDVFVALPKAVKRFRGDAALRTFLTSIAVNHAKKHVRAAARRRAAMERFAREPIGDGTGDPEGDAQRRQLAAALSRALDKLPLDQRVAFVLCEVEQRTSVEAAAVVAAPEETVRTRLFHARKKLRAHLEKEGIR